MSDRLEQVSSKAGAPGRMMNREQRGRDEVSQIQHSLYCLDIKMLDISVELPGDS